MARTSQRVGVMANESNTSAPERKTQPLVVALYEEDITRLLRLVTARNAARPEGARKVSRSAVIRDLIREAVEPEAMTEDLHAR